MHGQNHIKKESGLPADGPASLAGWFPEVRSVFIFSVNLIWPLDPEC